MNPGGTPRPEPAERSRKSVRPTLEQLERKEGHLWRMALLLLILLAAAFALISWDSVRALSSRLEALPAALVVLVLLFGIYVWSRSRQIAELRGLVRGIQHRTSAPPSERQLDRLFALIVRSQQGYRDLIDTFDDLLFAVSLNGKIRAVNRSFADLFDRPFSEIIGHQLDEFVDDADGAGRAAAQKALQHLMERRRWAGVIRVQLKKSGAVRHFDCILHAIVKGDRVVGLSGLARDITRQRENEARFTELFETLHEGVYFAAPDGTILDANPALVRILGFERKEELLGIKLSELYASAAASSEGSATSQDTDTLQIREVVLKRRDGRPAVCLDTCTAVRDPSGRILRFQGTLLDITPRREMEKRLYRQQEFARRLVDSFPDLIVVLDVEGRYTFVSPRIKELLGYSPEELIGLEVGQRAHPEDRPAMLDVFKDLVAGKRNYISLEYRTRHKQGDWRSFRAVACPLLDEAGKIAGVIASARDVTELKRLEQQLIQSEKLAAMGQMIAGVAHELNNPLTAILGVSELLRERATEESSRRHLDLVHRQARRAVDIVNDVLAFSRPPTPRRSAANLSELVQRTLQLHEHSLQKNHIAVDFLPDPNLPPIVGDPHQLIRVFLNLITNAEHAIREVRDQGILRIRLRAEANHVSAVFQDDGPGIRADDLPRLFDPFFTTKRPGRGTGLGLSICMAIVREHGGRVEAQNVPGGGAVFTVSLPVACQEQPGLAASPATRPHEEPAAEPYAILQGRAVLVVDDDETICELVHDGLSARGVKVDSAATAEEALRLAASRAYDAVLCDVNLSGRRQQSISSEELLLRLLSVPGNAKSQFIFMTGDPEHPAIQELKTRSSCRVLPKPFRISELVALLSEAVQDPEGEPHARAPR